MTIDQTGNPPRFFASISGNGEPVTKRDYNMSAKRDERGNPRKKCIRGTVTYGIWICRRPGDAEVENNILIRRAEK
jgi:hypothetical protein